MLQISIAGYMPWLAHGSVKYKVKGMSAPASCSLHVARRAGSACSLEPLAAAQTLASSLALTLQALLLANGERLPYDKLCICAGARPKQLPADAFRASAAAPGHKEQQQEGQAGRQPARQAGAWELEQARRRVLTIRDTDSVARLAALLASVRRVAVVGNGGIALELV